VSDPMFDQAWRSFRSHVRFMRFAERLWLAPLVFAVAGFIVMMASGLETGSSIVSVLMFALIGASSSSASSPT
jgi:hypothetical protein